VTTAKRGVLIDQPQHSSQDDLPLLSASDPRAASFDVAAPREPRSPRDFEQGRHNARRYRDLAQDVFGNAVATASFNVMADCLVIDSVAALELDAVAWPVFDIAASAISYPFRYSDDDWADLGGLAALQYPDSSERLRPWARSFVCSSPTDTLSLLKDIGAGLSQSIRYQSREVEGTQPPMQTLVRGWGSCRDFAVLFAEAVRTLGFGARSSRAISTILIRIALDRITRDRPMPGRRSMCPAQAGSHSIRRTAASVASI
jgi:hypothetical protein